MHRSTTVRSAPNVWSIPSGLQEIGDTLYETIFRELEEEYGFQDDDILRTRLIGMYENIGGDEPSPAELSQVRETLLEDGIPIIDKESLAIITRRLKEQYHWIITLFCVVVEDVTKAVNKEPDKHDRMEFVPIDLLMDGEFYEQFKFHKSLEDCLLQHRRSFLDTIRNELEINSESRNWANSDDIVVDNKDPVIVSPTTLSPSIEM